MRPSEYFVAAAIFGIAASASVTACIGRETGTTTVTSGQSGSFTGTGATGGSTPETDMQGTGRSERNTAIPREVARPVDPVPIQPERPPEREPDRVDAGVMMDAGPHIEGIEPPNAR